jgi:hypothetical protein
MKILLQIYRRLFKVRVHYIVRVTKSRRMSWAGYVTSMGEKKGAYRILVGRPEGRRIIWRPRHRGEDNIKMDLQEVGWGHELDRAGSG